MLDSAACSFGGGPVRTSPLTPQSAGVSLNPHAQARKPGENEWKFARKREGKQGNTHPPCTRRVTSPCAATSRLNLCGAATPFNNRRSRLGLRVRGESPPPVSKGPIRRQRGGVSGGPAPGPPPEHATCARGSVSEGAGLSASCLATSLATPLFLLKDRVAYLRVCPPI